MKKDTHKTKNKESLEDLIKNLFFYLDKEEESDFGRIFKPNYITSCRAVDGEKIGKILQKMRVLVFKK